MFNILLISIISSIFLTFFQYIHDSLNMKDDEIIDIQKYIVYFFINIFSIFSSIYLFNLFTKSDIEKMNLNVEIPDF